MELELSQRLLLDAAVLITATRTRIAKSAALLMGGGSRDLDAPVRAAKLAAPARRAP